MSRSVCADTGWHSRGRLSRCMVSRCDGDLERSDQSELEPRSPEPTRTTQVGSRGVQEGSNIVRLPRLTQQKGDDSQTEIEVPIGKSDPDREDGGRRSPERGDRRPREGTPVQQKFLVGTSHPECGSPPVLL